MTSPLICVRSLCGCVEFRRQLEVNVTGQLAVTQALLPLLRRARGRIVLIGSIGTRFTPPFTGPVSASKSTIATMAEALRQKLAPWDIHIGLIEPASVHTEAVDKLDRDAERLLRESNPYARALYEDAFRRFVRIGLARERNGSPPQVVAQAVARALTSRGHTPTTWSARTPCGWPSLPPRCPPRPRRPAPQDRPPTSTRLTGHVPSNR
jgi:NAD(P)-dependent dehydrogenase (short-subunit alcohol dehydrogenase family)